MHLRKKSFTTIALLLAIYFLICFGFNEAGSITSKVGLVSSSTSHIELAKFSIDVNDLSKYAERVEVVDSSTSTRFESLNHIRSLIDRHSASYLILNTLFSKPFRHLQILEQHLSIPIVLKRLQI